MSDVKIKNKNFHINFIDELSSENHDNSKIRTCIQCGSCTSSCVANDEMSISPRKLWRSVQMGLEQEVMFTNNYWSCTTCGLCDKRCPRGISLSQIMLKLRERLTNKEGLISQMVPVDSFIQKNKNITGDNENNRFLWIENMGLSSEEKNELFKTESEVVYYTGCVSSLFPQVYKIPQALTKLLLNLNVKFSLLKEEWCCGYPLMAGGKGIDSVKELAVHNVSEINKKGAKTLIVSCPTCYYMFTKIYPKVLEQPINFKVLHYSEYLSDKLKEKKTDFIDKEVTVTYHDPCDLGRKLKITQAPRDIINNLPGVNFVEMRFNREDGKCCGGGGNLEMVNPELSLEIAKKRIEEALATNATYILTSCQQCKRTLQNAARKMRARVKVNDLMEFIDMRRGEN